MTLKDLRDVLSDGHRLPINGKTYTIPHASAEAGLIFSEMMGVAAKVAKAQEDGAEPHITDADTPILSDAEEMDLYGDVLGDTRDEMLDDGLRYEHLKHAAMYSLIYAVMGEDRAVAYWNAGGKAPRPNRAARRTGTRTQRAGAGTTKPRASRSGTSTPKAKPRAQDSSGPTSSSTGE